MDVANSKKVRWIHLEEYADRYKISLSFLQKKVADGEIECKISSEKYLIKDQPLLEKNLSDTEILNSLPTNLEEKHKELTAALKQKNQEWVKLKAEYEDLKNLVQWLEKDNKEMRYVLNSLHRMDKWMRDTENNPSI